MSGAVAASAIALSPDNSDATQTGAPVTPTNASAVSTNFPPPLILPLDPPKSARRAGAGATVLVSSARSALVAATADSIPRRVLAAYVASARDANQQWPGCGITWYLLAGIGSVESDHARTGGSARPDWSGTADPPIYGPLLDGRDGVSWPDTDGGRLDGNAVWDRAVGPMQFMPSSWAMWAADGNHDHRADPQQIDDATMAAAHYLCAAGGRLTSATGRITAVYSYNHSIDYVRDVLSAAAHYAGLSPQALGLDGLPSTTPPAASPTPSPRGTERAGSPTPSASSQESFSPTPSATASETASASASPTDAVTATP